MATTPPITPPATPRAPTDPRDEAFLREVDDAYREDAMRDFFRRWGRWILLVVALLLAALGGWMWWQAEQTRRVEASSEQLSAALDQIDAGQSAEALEKLQALDAKANPAYRALANFAEAGLAVSGGDTARAGTLLGRIAEDARAPQPLRDAAAIRLLRLEFDRLEPQEIIRRTEPYLAGDNPWFPLAGELAALAHIRAGEPQAAGPIFLRIASDQRAPMSLRARAEQMAAALGQDVTRLAEARAALGTADDEAANPDRPAAAPQ